MTKAIFGTFYRVTGLVDKYFKSQAFPIRCEEEHTKLISKVWGCVIASFPCTYLGVPLTHCLRRRVYRI